MKSFLLAKVHRRDVFRAAVAGASIGAGGTMADQAGAAQPTGSVDKRRPRYQGNTPEI